MFVALEGITVAFSVSVFPTSRSRLELLREIPVGFTISGFSTTVTVTVAVRPLEVFAVMVAVPFETAEIVPPVTVATDVLLEDHVTDLFVASEGVIVAVILAFEPSLIVADVWLSVIPVGSTFFTSIETGPMFSAALRFSG